MSPGVCRCGQQRRRPQTCGRHSSGMCDHILPVLMLHLSAPDVVSSLVVFHLSSLAIDVSLSHPSPSPTLLLYIHHPVNPQVLGMDVPVSKALAGCMVAAGVVALLAVLRVLSVVLGIVPDSIKLAVVRMWMCGCGCVESLVG